jgi:hypothetical protein
VDVTSVANVELDGALGPDLARALCRSLGFVARSTSISLIPSAGSLLCSYPVEVVLNTDLASWAHRSAVRQPMLWQGEQVVARFRWDSCPVPAAMALITLAYDDPRGTLLLSWREAPAFWLAGE